MGRMSVANYEEEKELFAELVASDREPNILLFQGESGSGKSHLIDYLLDSVDDIPSVHFQLGSRGEAIPGVFTKLGRKVGWELLPRFSDRVVGLLEQPGEEIDLLSLHRFITEIGKMGDVESRHTHFQLLTDAFFADVQRLDTPILLAIDAYEKVPTQFDRWIRYDFLTGVAETGAMRVLVGGQKVPELEDSWGYSAEFRELKGIPDVDAWLAWTAQEGYTVTDPDYLAQAVATIGNPSRIVEFIGADKERFPQTRTTAGPRLLGIQQRKRLVDTIVRVFNLSELRNICFYLGIKWENLPEHDRLSGFARELLSYVIAISRLHELLALFQDERPPKEQWVI